MIRILILFVLFTLYSEGQDLNINLKKVRKEEAKIPQGFWLLLYVK